MLASLGEAWKCHSLRTILRHSGVEGQVTCAKASKKYSTCDVISAEKINKKNWLKERKIISCYERLSISM